jgi:cobalt-zinc-cadmium resistance protein CzcA
MSLGAIDFGLIIDGAVVMVENIVRHLAEKQHKLGRTLTLRSAHEVLKSAKEVASPMFFGVLIITVVYVPILALTGIEGKMFKPMALTSSSRSSARWCSRSRSCPRSARSICSGGNIAEKDSFLVRAKAAYTPFLNFALRARWSSSARRWLLFALAVLSSADWARSSCRNSTKARSPRT